MLIDENLHVLLSVIFGFQRSLFVQNCSWFAVLPCMGKGLLLYYMLFRAVEVSGIHRIEDLLCQPLDARVALAAEWCRPTWF